MPTRASPFDRRHQGARDESAGPLLSAAEITKALGIGRASVYRVLEAQE
jgi:predicted DNA-binding transcriptional regulator AlpA